MTRDSPISTVATALRTLRPDRFGPGRIGGAAAVGQSGGGAHRRPPRVSDRAVDQAPGGEVDEDRDDEQHHPEADERGAPQFASSHRTRWRSPTASSSRLEQLGGDLRVGADHQRGGDRLTHRPPEAERDGPTIPPLLWAKTAPRIISQRVAPSAEGGLLLERAASSSNTSRVSDVMIGMIMIARITPAVKNDRPLAGPSNSLPMTGIADRRRSRVVEAADRIGQHEDAPETEHDRRHHGEQIEHGRPPARLQPLRRDLGDEQGDSDAQRHREARSRSPTSRTCRR